MQYYTNLKQDLKTQITQKQMDIFAVKNENEKMAE
jgi:hypothetical protein